MDLRPYAKQLKSHTPQGAPGYCREAILRAFLAAPMEGITTFTMLHRRLQTDLRFRYQCGFRLDQDAPSVSTFSRVFADMVEKQIAEQLFHDLVSSCQTEGLMITQHLLLIVQRLKRMNENSRRRSLKPQEMPRGVPSLIRMATKSPGLATKFILLWIRKVSFPLL